MRTRFILPMALALFVAACGGDGGASLTTTGTSQAGNLVFARVPNDEAVFGGSDEQEMLAVAAGGPGLVAVGHDDVVYGDGDAAVWTSPDGLTWSRVPHDEAVFGGPGWQRMWGVAAGGPGLIAVGGSDLSGGVQHGAVWTSADGVTWSRVPHDEAAFGGPGEQEMLGVAAGGPGLVAVGYHESDAAVWTSPDGMTWSRVPHDDAVFGGSSSQVMWGVAAGGPGLVAVGFDRSGGVQDVAVWTSADGVTWSRVPHDEAVFGGARNQTMFGVVAGGPGLVAVGSDHSDGNLNAAVWTSPDGLIWSRVPHNEGVFGGSGEQEMLGVAAGEPGLVAVGYEDVSYEDGDAAVWISLDGLIWSRVPHNEGVFGGSSYQTMFGVAAGGPGLVAVGGGRGQGSEDYLDAAVWTLRSG